MKQTVFDTIVSLLESSAITFTTQRHEPAYTSEEAARARGTALSSGAKALVCKCDDVFHMFVMPADRKLISRNLRKYKICRRTRFATLDEVKRITGLIPGCIPPFGSLFELKTFCDRTLSSNEFINFSAGDHGRSIQMRYEDYIRIENPTIGDYISKK